jgi:MraZ protein
MFIGEYQHAIDPKNRIIIPSKFREDINDRFVITKGLDNCLYAYTMDEWAILEQKLRNLPLSSKDARSFVRFFFSGAVDCELDKQGRFVLPVNLVEYANIKKVIVTIGVSTRFEIWSKENWDEYNSSNMDFDLIAEKMSQLGI